MDPKQPPLNPFYKPSSPATPAPHQTGMDKLETSLDEGQVVIYFPDKLSKASVEEFEYWINGLVRRVRRKAGLSLEGDAK